MPPIVLPLPKLSLDPEPLPAELPEAVVIIVSVVIGGGRGHSLPDGLPLPVAVITTVSSSLSLRRSRCLTGWVACRKRSAIYSTFPIEPILRGHTVALGAVAVTVAGDGAEGASDDAAKVLSLGDGDSLSGQSRGKEDEDG